MQQLHKDMLVITSLAMVCVFVVYKIVYPFPDFMPDSYFYLMMAHGYNFQPLIWPVGYSWFLNTVGYVTHSPLLLVVLQYVLLQAASLWLAFTLFTVFAPPRWAKIAILAFLAFNPMYLYLANLVSSDAVFTALTLVWINVLLRMLLAPRRWHLLVQALLVTYLFIMRHQALYYPLVMVLVLIVTRYNRRWRIFSAVLAIWLIGWFVSVTKITNLKTIGINAFSGFSGWQLASNALYMYPYVAVDTSVFHATIQEEVDWHVRRYVDTTFGKRHYPTPLDGPGLILAMDGPLKYHQFKSLMRRYPHKDGMWYYHKAGKDFGEYGKELIGSHPFAYTRYFILPNVWNYLFPMLEQFWKYNEGHYYVWPEAQKWFGLQNGVFSYWLLGSFYVLTVCRYLFVLLNVAILVLAIVAWRKKILDTCSAGQRRVWLLLALAFGANAVFSILASPVMFRYQVYGMALGWMLLCLLLGFIRTVNARKLIAYDTHIPPQS